MIAELMVSLWFFGGSGGKLRQWNWVGGPYATQVQCEEVRAVLPFPTKPCEAVVKWVTFDSGKQP